VHRAQPEAEVVYVENNPVVPAHSRALPEDGQFTHMIEADIFKPATVLDHPVVSRNIDFSQPVVLMHVGTLHHLVGDAGGPW
jgi:hypothetical protein